ncbi:MAG: Myo-inositol 2-dehydrogenase, partial [Phycisphaerales bacterium]|nr:Myo-inositol 2-dehydrogenase [Phycisphaerales bacterium]
MKHLSRRLFMQESLLAAAAIALPSRAVLAEDTPPPRSGPSERLSVAVIGVNGRGREHAKAYAARGDCVVSHICDADEKVGRAFAEGFEGKPKFVQDLRRIFDDKSVDVVSIATPNHWHSLA